MSSKYKKIFIAGSTGLVGSSVVKLLLDAYDDVSIRAAWHFTRPFIKDRRVVYVKANLADRDECRKAIRGCDCAIVAAGVSGGAASHVAESYRQIAENMAIDAFLLESLYEEGVRRVVFMSSATIYQPFQGYIREDQLDLNKDPHPAFLGFGWAKRATEKLCQFWHENYGQEIVVLRCSNVFGPFAKFNPENSNFIPALIRKAVDKMDPFEIWGSPRVVRDVIYSEDLAKAIVMAVHAKSVKRGVFNVGSGKTITIGEVAEMVLNSAGHRPGKVVFSGKAPTTMEFKALDCSKLRKTIGWKPEFSIEKGLDRTVQWWIDNRTWWKR